MQLDVFNFNPNWIETKTGTFRARIEEAISGECWVTDGNYIGKDSRYQVRSRRRNYWLDELRALWMVHRLTMLSAPQLGVS